MIDLIGVSRGTLPGQTLPAFEDGGPVVVCKLEERQLKVGIVKASQMSDSSAAGNPPESRSDVALLEFGLAMVWVGWRRAPKSKHGHVENPGRHQRKSRIHGRGVHHQ